MAVYKTQLKDPGAMHPHWSTPLVICPANDRQQIVNGFELIVRSKNSMILKILLVSCSDQTDPKSVCTYLTYIWIPIIKVR